MKHVYLFGLRGLPAAHGGFETLAEALTPYLSKQGWQVTVFCQAEGKKQHKKIFYYKGARCVQLAPVIFGRMLHGTIATGLFDFYSFLYARKLSAGAWLTFGYNTGFLNFLFKRKSCPQMINMDGMEWQRDKWNWIYKIIFRINYIFSMLAGNILVADHPEIAKILRKSAIAKRIVTIAYGADAVMQANHELLQPYQLLPKEYGLVIARSEPENNILAIVQAWSRKKRHMPLFVLGKYDDKNSYHRKIKNAASDEVIFPGAIYKSETVRALRFFASIYFHGHKVGGTNPSLVEALAAGNAIIAHDNPFNRYVADQSALYFKGADDLAEIIDHVMLAPETMQPLSMHARARHAQDYQWPLILEQYQQALILLFENFA